MKWSPHTTRKTHEIPFVRFFFFFCSTHQGETQPGKRSVSHQHTNLNTRPWTLLSPQHKLVRRPTTNVAVFVVTALPAIYKRADTSSPELRYMRTGGRFGFVFILLCDLVERNSRRVPLITTVR